MPSKNLPYRRNVGIMLLNQEGLIFIGRRRSDDSLNKDSRGALWQMPQGGIDDGEEPYEAALRELEEETSVRTVTFLAEAPEWFTYELPVDVIESSWGGKYRGQTQKWFAFRFQGNESEINILEPPHGHKAEFDEWRWVPMQTLCDLIVDFKRPVYAQVVQAFASLAPLPDEGIHVD